MQARCLGCSIFTGRLHYSITGGSEALMVSSVKCSAVRLSRASGGSNQDTGYVSYMHLVVAISSTHPQFVSLNRLLYIPAYQLAN
jgi:hypothetical protein